MKEKEPLQCWIVNINKIFSIIFLVYDRLKGVEKIRDQEKDREKESNRQSSMDSGHGFHKFFSIYPLKI
jgi:hypothetical protein